MRSMQYFGFTAGCTAGLLPRRDPEAAAVVVRGRCVELSAAAGEPEVMPLLQI